MTEEKEIEAMKALGAETEKMVEDIVGLAMRQSGLAVRDGCLYIIRKYGGRVSNDQLISFIEGMPIPGKEE